MAEYGCELYDATGYKYFSTRGHLGRPALVLDVFHILNTDSFTKNYGPLLDRIGIPRNKVSAMFFQHNVWAEAGVLNYNKSTGVLTVTGLSNPAGGQKGATLVVTQV